MNLLIGTIVSFFSLFLSSIIQTKIGIAKNLRLSFLISFLSGLLICFVINKGYWIYILFNILRSIVNGFYWSSVNVLEYNEIKANARTKILSFMVGIERIMFTILPILTGWLLVKYNNPIVIFIPYVIFWGSSLLIPLDFFDHKVYTFSFKKLFKLTKREYFNDLILLRIVMTSKWAISKVLFSLIPLVIFTSAFQLGTLTTVITIVSGILSIILIKYNFKAKKDIAKNTLPIVLLNYIYFYFNLTPVGYYVSSLIQTFTSVLLDPVEADLEVRGIKIFVNDNYDISLETNVWNEFTNMVMNAFFTLLALIVIYFTSNILITLKLSIVLNVIFTFLTFSIFSKFVSRHTKLLKHN